MRMPFRDAKGGLPTTQEGSETLTQQIRMGQVNLKTPVSPDTGSLHPSAHQILRASRTKGSSKHEKSNCPFKHAKDHASSQLDINSQMPSSVWSPDLQA